MQLGVLEQSHSEGVRRRAHMVHRGMTDLSPDSGSSEEPQVEEEEKPESENIATHYHTGATATSTGHAEAAAMDKQFREDLDEADGYLFLQTCQGESSLRPQQDRSKVATMRQTARMAKATVDSHVKCTKHFLWFRMACETISATGIHC